jgi:hypothetical protein
MGLFSDIGDAVKGVGSAVVNPVGYINEQVIEKLTGSDILGSIVNPIGAATDLALSGDLGGLDFLDLTGEKAKKTAAAIDAILKQSAQEGIALNEAQLAEIERLTTPFREAAVGTALPQLSALALGGDVDFRPSRLFQTQLEQGRAGILKGQAAGSGIKSSATFGKLSDLVSGLATEDVGRFERGQKALLEAGRGAEAGLTAAGGRLTGATGDILSGLGAGQAAVAQSLAQQNLAAGKTAAGGLAGLSQLLLTG